MREKGRGAGMWQGATEKTLPPRKHKRSRSPGEREAGDPGEAQGEGVLKGGGLARGLGAGRVWRCWQNGNPRRSC